MATTSWPRRRLLELPSRAAGSETSSTTRSRARSVCGSSPSTRALTVRVSASASRTGGGALHDVAVGQDQAIGRDHHARAGAAALALLAVGRRLDPHDSGTDAVDDVDHRLRVGVEQEVVVDGFCGGTCFRRAELVGDEEGLEVEHAPIWGSGRADVHGPLAGARAHDHEARETPAVRTRRRERWRPAVRRDQNSEKYSRCSQSLTSNSKRSISACFSLR